jgi:hypothetical protein
MDGTVDPALLGLLFEALPVPLFVVDEDVRILASNGAARALAGTGGTAAALRTRGGEALHCINSINAFGGCGHAEACRTCVVRGAVTTSARAGAVVRKPQRMRLAGAGGEKDMFVLVTTAPLRGEGPARVVLLLQEIGELVSVEGLVPVCMHCRKVRDEAQGWQPMEAYLKANLDVDVTHGLCPDCLRVHYPEYAHGITVEEEGRLTAGENR